MIIDIFIREVSEQNLENEFISIFLILYLLLFTVSINVLNEKKMQVYFSVDKWFSVLNNEVFNRNSNRKNYFVYSLAFVFVWFLFVILIMNTALLKNPPNLSGLRAYLYFVLSFTGFAFLILKSILTMLIGDVFAIPKSAYHYAIIDFKVWLFYSFMVYPIVVIQVYSSISVPDFVVLILLFTPLLLILLKKILFLFSVKEYSWFIKLLYLCIFEIVVYFVCIRLIVSYL